VSFNGRGMSSEPAHIQTSTVRPKKRVRPEVGRFGASGHYSPLGRLGKGKGRRKRRNESGKKIWFGVPISRSALRPAAWWGFFAFVFLKRHPHQREERFGCDV
jgi:hypothetical protein